MKELDGKVAIITGGASGIGRESALVFGRAGAKVVIADINDKMAEETLELSREDGSEMRYIRTDVSKVSDVEKMIRETVGAFGKLNIFWHNAGIGNPGPGTTPEQGFDRIVAVHVKGGYFGANSAIPEIKKAGGGSVLFTGSVAGVKPAEGGPVYSLAKAGLISLAKSLAIRHGGDNIRVNCICPGGTSTPMLTESWQEENRKRIPLGRIGKPHDLAQAALFLVSDAASYITGAVIMVDGGLSAV